MSSIVLRVEKLNADLRDRHKIDLLVKYNETVGELQLWTIRIMDEKDRCRGTGTKVMQEIIEFADKYSLPMMLEITDEWGSNYDRLEKFYRSFGFKKGKDVAGLKPDSSYIRQPKSLKK